jgi:hypothetical protein
LLLLLAFSTSGFSHLKTAVHDASEAMFTNEMLSNNHEAVDGSCCLKLEGQPDSIACSTAYGCSFCMPLQSAPVSAPLLFSERLKIWSEDIHQSLAQAIQFRPPKVDLNV